MEGERRRGHRVEVEKVTVKGQILLSNVKFHF